MVAGLNCFEVMLHIVRICFHDNEKTNTINIITNLCRDYYFKEVTHFLALGTYLTNCRKSIHLVAIILAVLE